MPLPKMPRIVPPQGFRFVVTFAGVPMKLPFVKGASTAVPPLLDSFWQEVSGLSMRTEFESVQEAGRFGSLQLPKGHSYEDLTLKRGFSPGSALSKWVRHSIGQLDYHPAQATVILFNAEVQPVAIWSCFNVIPVSWSVSPLDANSSSVVIETLVLRYESFEFEPAMPDVG